MAETRYFRVPAMLDHSDLDAAGHPAELGRPGTMTRNYQYEPDERGVIAVDDHDDADAFAREAGFIEVVGAQELPSPPASRTRAMTDQGGSRSATEGGKQR